MSRNKYYRQEDKKIDADDDSVREHTRVVRQQNKVEECEGKKTEPSSFDRLSFAHFQGLRSVELDEGEKTDEFH